MTILIIRFLNILMAELIAGTIFGIWIGYNPQNLSSPTYI
jgi:F0F1-type ATP synthase assembly protein I